MNIKMGKFITLILFAIILSLSVTAQTVLMDTQGKLLNKTTGAGITAATTFNETIQSADNTILYSESGSLSLIGGIFNYVAGYKALFDANAFFNAWKITPFITKTLRFNNESTGQVNMTYVPLAVVSIHSNNSASLNGMSSGYWVNETEFTALNGTVYSLTNGSAGVTEQNLKGNITNLNDTLRIDLNYTAYDGNLSIDAVTKVIQLDLWDIIGWGKYWFGLLNTTDMNRLDKRINDTNTTTNIQGLGFYTAAQTNNTIDNKLTGDKWYFHYNNTQTGTAEGTLNLTWGNYGSNSLNLTEAVGGLIYYANTSNNITIDVNEISIRYKAIGDDYLLEIWDNESQSWESYGNLVETTDWQWFEQSIRDMDEHIWMDNTFGIRITHKGTASTQHKLYIDNMYLSSGYSIQTSSLTAMYYAGANLSEVNNIFAINVSLFNGINGSCEKFEGNTFTWNCSPKFIASGSINNISKTYVDTSIATNLSVTNGTLKDWVNAKALNDNASIKDYIQLANNSMWISVFNKALADNSSIKEYINNGLNSMVNTSGGAGVFGNTSNITHYASGGVDYFFFNGTAGSGGGDTTWSNGVANKNLSIRTKVINVTNSSFQFRNNSGVLQSTLQQNLRHLEINTNHQYDDILLHDTAYGGMYETGYGVGFTNVFQIMPFQQRVPYYDNVDYNQTNFALYCNVTGTYILDYDVSARAVDDPSGGFFYMNYLPHLNGAPLASGQSFDSFALIDEYINTKGGTIFNCNQGDYVQLYGRCTNTGVTVNIEILAANFYIERVGGEIILT